MACKIKNKSTVNGRFKLDNKECDINSITELPNGEIVVADSHNDRVKVMNIMLNFHVTSHCDLPSSPTALCHIAGAEVAVTLKSEKVLDPPLVSADGIKMTRKFKLLDHNCISIGHRGGQLYVASATALYQYTTAGQQVKKIHEDTTGPQTLSHFSLSKDGQNIYISDWCHSKIITIGQDGKVLAEMQDDDIMGPYCVHVSEGGNMFVSSWRSGTVVQLDQEGKKKLATLVTREGSRTFQPQDFSTPSQN